MIDRRVFDRLFGPSEPPQLLRGWHPKKVGTPVPSPELARSASEPVDIVALIRAIDKLEACVARLKRFLMVDGRGVA